MIVTIGALLVGLGMVGGWVIYDYRSLTKRFDARKSAAHALRERVRQKKIKELAEDIKASRSTEAIKSAGMVPAADLDLTEYPSFAKHLSVAGFTSIKQGNMPSPVVLRVLQKRYASSTAQVRRAKRFIAERHGMSIVQSHENDGVFIVDGDTVLRIGDLAHS